MRPSIRNESSQPTSELTLELGLQRVIARRRVVSKKNKGVRRRDASNRINLCKHRRIPGVCRIDQITNETSPHGSHVAGCERLLAAELLLQGDVDLVNIRQLEMGIDQVIGPTVADWK